MSWILDACHYFVGQTNHPRVYLKMMPQSYIEFFRDAYNKEWTYLSEINEYFLKFFIKELGISVEFVKASSLPFKLEGEKSDLVLDLCKKMQADVFIFGETGETYAKIKDFVSSNIKIIFQIGNTG